MSIKRHMVKGALLATALFAFASPGAVAQDEEYPKLQLRSGQGLSSAGFGPQAHQWWADEIGRRTNGQVTVETFWGGSLIAYRDLPAGIASGAVEIGQVPSTYDPARTRLWMTLDMPLNIRDHYCGVTATRRIAFENEHLAAELRRNNLVPLVGYNSGWMQFISKDPITSLADLQGRRMRSYGGARIPFLETLGITPVFMPFNEIYEAIDRGVLDGSADVTLYLAEAFKLQEAAPNFLITNSGVASAAPLAVMNLQLWESLPENLQELIKQISVEHDEKFARELISESERVRKAFEADPNINVHYLSEEDTKKIEEMAAQVQEKWLADAEAAGLPARDVWDHYQRMQRECEADVAANGYPWER